MKQFILANVFCDGMIIQQNADIRLFGEAMCDCLITAEINNQKVIKDIKQGYFEIMLAPEKAGIDMTIRVSTKEQNEIINNVFCGEVWVACGQSNMSLFLKDTEGFLKGEKVVPNENIRFYTVGRNILCSKDDYGCDYEWAYNEDVKWDGCNEKNALAFSAIGYYFAKLLQNVLNVPVGIINCNLGGSSIFNWIPKEKISNNKDIANVLTNYQNKVKNLDMKEYAKKYRQYLDSVKIDNNQAEDVIEQNSCFFEEYGPYNCALPSVLYNTMLKKIIKYQVKGMLWYQGEFDAIAAYSEIYKSAMYSLVDNLKKESRNPYYNFMFVQLPPCNYPDAIQWQDICNIQREFSLENTQYGMITIGDCGDDNIHPPRKKPVGERLALATLNLSYNTPQEYCGPVATKANFANGKISIEFIHNEGMYIKGNIGYFEVENQAGEFKKYRAYLSENVVYIDYTSTEKPKSVRYAWATFYHIGLYNNSNLPASVFKIYIIE